MPISGAVFLCFSRFLKNFRFQADFRRFCGRLLARPFYIMAGLCPDTPIIKEVSRALAARLNRARGSLFTFFLLLIKRCCPSVRAPRIVQALRFPTAPRRARAAGSSLRQFVQRYLPLQLSVALRRYLHRRNGGRGVLRFLLRLNRLRLSLRFV